MAVWSVWAMVLAVVLSTPHTVSAYYHTVSESIPSSSAIYINSEGPMWGKATAPYGSDDPYVRMSISLKSQSSVLSLTGKVWLMFFQGEDATDQVGVKLTADAEDVSLCCTPTVMLNGGCEEQDLDHPVFRPGYDEDNIALQELELNHLPDGFFNTSAAHSFKFHTSGEKAVAIMMCDHQNSTTVDFSGRITYKNPYGYVPGVQYAYGPLYAALMVAYALLLLYYAVAMMRNSEYLLPLQTAVACVVVVGLVEVMAWVVVYWTKNDTGNPPCCPVSPEVVLAVVLKVLKQGVSRWLLLSVCLGFGVVQERLEKGSLTFVTGLTIAYILLGLNVEIRYATSETLVRTPWEFPLFLVDLTFLLCIQASLTNMRRMLTTSSQLVKLGMYNKLAATLGVFIAVWFACTVLLALVELKYLDVGWQLLWVVFRFWDVLYFFLLFVIAVLWRPSRQSYQYSTYSQPAPLDDDEELGGVEMTAGGGGAGFQIGDDSDSEVEIDLTPSAITADPRGPRTTRATGSGRGGRARQSAVAVGSDDDDDDGGFDDGGEADDDGDQLALDVGDVDLRDLRPAVHANTD